jgi:GalNAc-alpha-(1->4)-GalNAc-alpha-(1->3)-diNAcBac-PP-undecaprenol alpha-1,4-N-acetyl-D-galactosaminyltransferase
VITAPTRKFVFVTGSLQGGGAERQLADMANYWAAKGVSVTFATWTGAEVADFYRLDRGIRRAYLDVPAKSGGALVQKIVAQARRVLKLRKLLSAIQPDAVLSFLPESNVLTILAAARLRTRIVISERAHPISDTTLAPWLRTLRRILYARSDVIVAQTEDAAEWIRAHCRKRAVVIPNSLRAMPDLVHARERIVVAIGRLTKQKGFDLLLRAIALVAPDFPEWSTVIIGKGPERERLQQLSEELGLRERVRLLGEISDIETWLARAGMVVQPSRFEGFPNVVLEAMAMGAAVVSADCPAGPAELIDDGVNGRLVPVEDVETLASVMTELMSQPQLRVDLGREAMNVRQRFRQDLIMPRWEELLLPKGGPGGLALDSAA